MSYDHRTDEIDLSMMPQEDVSPSNSYVAGNLPPAPRLTMPNRPVRQVLNNLFFGNTRPGTQRARTTALKRGLLMAGTVGVVIAAIIAIVFVAKGVAFLSLVLPLAALVVACMAVALAAMCCYHCVVRIRERRTITTSYENVQESVNVYEPTPGPWELSGQTPPPQYPPVAPPVPAYGTQTLPTYAPRQQPLYATDPAREVRQFSSEHYSVYGGEQQPASTGSARDNFSGATAPAADEDVIVEEHDSSTSRRTGLYG